MHTYSGLSHLVEAATALSKLAKVQVHQSLHVPGDTKISPSDRVVVSDDDVDETKRTTTTTTRTTLTAGSYREIFPQRLMAILSDSSLSDVISWLPHGRSFVIIRPDALAEQVLTKHLPSTDPRSSTKYPSFTRKLNRWGFRQETRGPDTGAFYHPLFRRDDPNLCVNMVCQKSRSKRPSKITEVPESMIAESFHNSSLPPKKRKIQSVNRDSFLTGELDREKVHRMVSNHLSAAAVSGDDQSLISSSMPTSASPSPTPTITTTLNFPFYGLPFLPFTPKSSHVVVNDSKLVASSLKIRDEMERLAIAKSMLFDAYIRTLNGE